MRDPVPAYVLVTYTLFPEDPLKKIQVTEPKAELNWESNKFLFSLIFLTFAFLTETRSEYLQNTCGEGTALVSEECNFMA